MIALAFSNAKSTNLTVILFSTLILKLILGQLQNYFLVFPEKYAGNFSYLLFIGQFTFEEQGNFYIQSILNSFFFVILDNFKLGILATNALISTLAGIPIFNICKKINFIGLKGYAL